MPTAIPVPGSYLKMSPDGKKIAFTRPDRNVLHVSNLDNGELRDGGTIAAKVVHPEPVGFSPDGRFLVLGDEGRAEVEVWDVSEVRRPVLWVELQVQSRAFGPVEFTPDSRRIAVSADRSVRVWDLAGKGEANQVASFDDFSTKVTAIDYREDTGEFYGLDGDHTIWPLRTDVEQVIREHCGKGEMALFDEEWRRYFPDVERVPVC